MRVSNSGESTSETKGNFHYIWISFLPLYYYLFWNRVYVTKKARKWNE
jgi:hypothetical protein